MSRQAIGRELVRGWLPWVAGFSAIAIGLGVGWWLLIEPPRGLTETLVIPPGTAARVAAGEPAPFIPSSLSLAPGRSLTVLNRDTAEHRVGASVVPPGGTAEVRAAKSGGLSCTIHPSGSIGVDVEKRGTLLGATVPSVLLIGLPGGLLCAFVSSVAKRLGVEDDARDR